MGFISKKIQYLGALCLAGLLCISTTTDVSAAAYDDVLRVGLYYGSSALSSANLQNSVGSGYEFGYYNTSGTFVSLGETSEEKITICTDTNLYLSGGTFYSTPTAGSYQLIGAYNLQASGTYKTFALAQSAASAYPYGYPAYVNGAYVVRFEYFSSSANAQAELANYSGASVVGGSTSCYTVVNSDTGEILFEYDQGSSSYFAVMPSGNDTETWFKGYKYYGGFQYARRSGGDMTVTNFVDTDDYIVGVLPYEFVSSGGIESLKAGAVAIRTFAMSSYKHSSLGFDVCNSTCCQVYSGVYSSTNADNVYAAAHATHGECAYYNGSLIEAVYYASNGGATESALNTWGTDFGYLQGKYDPYESTISFGSQSWEYYITPAQVTTMLQNRGNNNSTIVSIEITERSATGNVNEIVFTDSNGKTYDYTGDNTRLLNGISGVTYMSRNFSVYAGSDTSSGGDDSTTFTVYDGSTTTTANSVSVLTADGVTTTTFPASVISSDGTYTLGEGSSSTGGTSSEGWTIVGGGYGHNVGMSQWGAYAMAKAGYTYDEILKFYYTGITIK